MIKASYIGWLGQKNIGDEACFQAICNLCRGKIDIKEYKKGDEEDPSRLIILGGGTLLHMGMDSRTKILVDAKGPIITWGSGVVVEPVMQGKSHVMPDELRQALHRAIMVAVRGPLSQMRLEENDFHESVVTSDPALLLEVDSFSSCDYVALNIGDTCNNLIGTEEHVLEETVKLVNKIISINREIVVLFSMWEPDVRFLHEVKNRVNSNKVIVRPFTDNPVSVLKFLRNARVVIGMKLHAVVLAAAAERPFVSIAYREKCVDFCKSIMMFTEDSYVMADDGNLADKVFERIEENDNIYFIERVKASVRKYRKQHEKILDTILKSLD